MAHGSIKYTVLIKDLCNRLGLAYDSRQLESERGLQSLLPQIEDRLSQLRDEDTYGNVEEIPTDSCPVVYARAPEKPAATLVDGALYSIMQSMVLTQVRLMLVAQTLTSAEASVGSSASSNRDTTWRILSDSFCPLLAEIRSELLLDEVFLSVMRIASDIFMCSRGSSSGSCCSNCSKDIGVSEQHKSSHLSNTSSMARSHGSGSNKGSHTSARTATSIQAAQTSSGATNSHSSSSFRGFPCYPSTRSGTTSSGGGGHGQARIWDQLVDGGRPRMESRLVTGGDAHQVSRGRDTQQQDWDEPPASWIEYAIRQAQAGQGSARSHNSEGELISYSNVLAGHRKGQRTKSRKPKARRLRNEAAAVKSNKLQEGMHHNDLVAARRLDYYWPIEDNYLQPYEGIAVVARDHWQFVLDKLDHCPAFARFNRLRRADMLAQIQKYPELNQLMAGDQQQASRPLELYNGIVHPLGLTAAPCRAVFLDS